MGAHHYSITGKAMLVMGNILKNKKIAFAVLAAAAVLAGVLRNLPFSATSKNIFFTVPDASAIAGMREFIRDHGKEDFDGDGLTGNQELNYSTDPRSPDTDNDGFSDDMEIYVSGTDPCAADASPRGNGLPEKDYAGNDTGDADALPGGKTSPIILPRQDVYDLRRYGANSHTLADLNFAYNQINGGRTTAVSLRSAKYGEIIALIYGYSANGNLLLADMNTLARVGELKITVSSARLTTSGGVVRRETFDFAGCGFDSKAGDSLHFIR
jgi:hypothetical protein